jgi:hypothetical protein
MVAQMSGTGERHSLPNKMYAHGYWYFNFKKEKFRSIGTRINQVLNNDFKKKMNDLDPLKGLTDVNILTVLNNHRVCSYSYNCFTVFFKIMSLATQSFGSDIRRCIWALNSESNPTVSGSNSSMCRGRSWSNARGTERHSDRSKGWLINLFGKNVV